MTHRFRSRRTTGSSILDHDFGHLCRGRRIHMSGHSEFEFSIILEHLLFLPGKKADTASAACPSQPGNLEMISMTFAAVICDADDPCWWPLFSEYCIRSFIIFHNITSECNSTFVFWVLCLQFSIFQMMHVHQWGEMNFSARHPCFIDHLFLTVDFCQVPRRNFLQFVPLSSAAFAAGIFKAWGIGINLWTKL